jgi:hypothetical protein
LGGFSNGTGFANIHSDDGHFSPIENFKGLRNREETIMLWTIFLVLLVLWALGFGVAGAALGNFIHILLVLAVVVLAIQLITGRRAAL